MVTSEDFKAALDLIEAAHRVLIISHTRPDGDACGSVSAMCDALKAQGKNAQAVFLSAVPEWYEFLFERRPPIFENEISLNEIRDCDFELIIIVDTNSYVQLPGLEDFLRQTEIPILVFDHHVTTDNIGRVQLVDSSAAAAGQIVFEFLKFAKWPITRGIAEALFVAFGTDTGWFRFANVDSRILRAAAELVDAGADPNGIYRKLYQSYSPERMRLLIRMLNTLELRFEGRVAVQHILKADFDAAGAKGRDTENLIDECQRIGSVEVALLFVELKDGGFRCSLRSKGAVDVRKIAQNSGGGGHVMAAGVNLPGPLEHAEELILTEVGQQLGAAS